jgi:hypothetical protein
LARHLEATVGSKQDALPPIWVGVFEDEGQLLTVTQPQTVIQLDYPPFVGDRPPFRSSKGLLEYNHWDLSLCYSVSFVLA